MLYLDTVYGPFNGVTVYGDNQNKSLFYYIVERPRLARTNGVPELLFLKYRRDLTDNPALDQNIKESLGGGFLSFTVDLGLEDQELESLKEQIAQVASAGDGEITLVPVQFRKGTVRLSIVKDAAEAPGSQPNQPKGVDFFEEVYGTSIPSLFGFNRATFSLVLSAEGAELIEAGLRAGLSPIGVIYDLEFLGLRPAFDVKITADYHRIYDSLSIDFGLKGQVYVIGLNVDIELAWQKLRDDGSIKVEVLNFTDDADLRKQADAAFEWFKKDLLNDFFSSSLQPPSFMKQLSSTTSSAAGATGTPPTGGGTSPAGGQPGAGKNPPSPSGGAQSNTSTSSAVGQLQNLVGGLNNAQSTKALNPTRGTPTTATPTPAQKPTNMKDNVAPTSNMNQKVGNALGTPANQKPGGAGAKQGAAGKGGSQLSITLGFTLKQLHTEELKTRVFEYSEQAAVARTAAPQGLFSSVVQGFDLNRAIIEVDLNDSFLQQVNSTISISDNFAVTGLTVVDINLEYPGTQQPGEQPTRTEGFTFKPGDLTSKKFTAWLNDKKDLTYRYQFGNHFKADAPWVGKDDHIVSDWIVTRAPELTLDPMDAIALLDVEITVGNISSGQVTQAQIDVWYQDANDSFINKQSFLLKPGDPSTHWRLRLTSAEQRTYQYRITYFFPNNLQHQTDWVSTDSRSIVVNDPFQGSLDLRLVPLLDAGSLIEADVDLTYREADTGYTRNLHQTFTPDNLKAQAISLPTLAKIAAPYTSSITVIRSDGSTFTSQPTTSSSPVLIISDGVGKIHAIQVHLPSKDLGNLAALKVDFTGSGDDPDFASVLFTPSQVNDRTVYLVQSGKTTAFSYTYKVTGYTQHGQPIAGDSGTATGSSLVVKMPSVPVS